MLAGDQAKLAQVEALVIEFSPFHMAKLNADGARVTDYLADFQRLAIMNGDQALLGPDLPFGSPGPVIDKLRLALNVMG